MSPTKLLLRCFLKKPMVKAGIIMLTVLCVFSFLGPFFSPYGEYDLFFIKDGVEFSQTATIDFSVVGIIINRKAAPSMAHPLGTDRDGRDVLVRLMYGGRISLMIGLGVMLIQLTIGIVLGSLAGYYGKWIDKSIMRLVDIFNCIPPIPLMLIMSSVLLRVHIPQQLRIYFIMLILAFLGWTNIARLVRGQILMLREQDFMLATKAIGLSPARRIFRHLLPNCAPQLIAASTLGIGTIILTESSLSFLGFGLPFPYASWGNMVNAVTDILIMRTSAHIWIPPGVCILLTVMSFNLIGEGLRDTFDGTCKI